MLADIPGLIEGAAAAPGSATSSSPTSSAAGCSSTCVARRPRRAERPGSSAYETVRARARRARRRARAAAGDRRALEGRPGPADEVEAAARGVARRLGDAIGVLAISSATGAGLDELMRGDLRRGRRPGGWTPRRIAGRAASAEFEAEHIVYRPAGEQGFDVVREDEAFRVAGRGVEMLVARHDLSQPRGARLPRAAAARDRGDRGARARGLRARRRGADRRGGVRARPRLIRLRTS